MSALHVRISKPAQQDVVRPQTSRDIASIVMHSSALIFWPEAVTL